MEQDEEDVAEKLLENVANTVVIHNLGHGKVALVGVADTNEMCVGVFSDDITALEALTLVRRGGGASGIINLGFGEGPPGPDVETEEGEDT